MNLTKTEVAVLDRLEKVRLDLHEKTKTSELYWKNISIPWGCAVVPCISDLGSPKREKAAIDSLCKKGVLLCFSPRSYLLSPKMDPPGYKMSPDGKKIFASFKEEEPSNE